MKRQMGFTLLEILVAMAIFAMIGTASYTVLTQVKRADKISERHSAVLEQMQRAHLLMERDFMQVAVRRVRQNESEPSAMLFHSEKGLMESEGDGVLFTRMGWTNPFGVLPRGNVQGVGYRLQEGRLERLHTLYPDAVTGTEPKVRVLLENIDSLTFKYFADKKWQEDWGKTNSIPEAVEITIESETLGNFRWVFLMTGASLEEKKNAES